MSNRRTPVPKPVAPAADPLAEFRDTDDTTPPVVRPGATGTSLPATDDGKPMEYLYATETLPEAIAMALALAATDTETVDLQEALARELLVRVGPGTPQAVALVTEDEQETVRNQMIAVWHNDTVAYPVLHKGGTCACRYLANAVLAVVLPAQVEDELSDLRDDEPEHVCVPGCAPDAHVASSKD